MRFSNISYSVLIFLSKMILLCLFPSLAALLQFEYLHYFDLFFPFWHRHNIYRVCMKLQFRFIIEFDIFIKVFLNNKYGIKLITLALFSLVSGNHIRYLYLFNDIECIEILQQWFRIYLNNFCIFSKKHKFLKVDILCND